ncbi:Eukaryotic translation initiation factor 5A-1 [Pelomyxa schiedti]|nr:Eukaryotic translation initiation factor 5A-1 [Pelomyxa schiedti]
MSDSDNQSGGDVGSDVFPQQCSALRKNGFVVLKGNPCKIVEMSTSKTGKHGHAKVHLVGIDIFSGKKYEDLCPSTHNMNVPNVTRADYQLINIDENSVSLLDDSGDTKDDLVIPEGEIGEKLRAAFDEGKELVVTVQKAMGIEQIVAFKEDSS